ncbi:MAG TPA: heat-inducible transcriptional repressor HrcA [Vicinamibacterales bacterium]|jgi:heat-inducible transcriptional repressor|nr:heat-inducible transcriptional repressor HrcA [Vicinamibacterales bacterium]
MVSHELSDRSRRLLAALVREHIATGEPVSSQALAGESGLGVSSATIRNMFARLEADGYLHQPHTSAGRVPTDRGYRVFVDLLLESRKPARSTAAEQELRQHAERSPLIDDLLVSVSHMVSRASKHVGFAIGSTDIAVLQRIEFVPLGGMRVLVVVVSRGNQVTQKVVDAGEEIRSDDLVQAANYLTSEFAGLPLVDVREAVLARLAQERTLYGELMGRALRLARFTLEELPRQNAFHVEGAASLLDAPAPDGVTLPTLRALLEMMEEKERMLLLLNQYIDGPGITVVIGGEHLSPDLRPFSLIASTTTDGSTIRTVGVIGPTRMQYSRAISVVDGVTQAVARVLRAN